MSDGTGWYSDDSGDDEAVPIYRLYNASNASSSHYFLAAAGTKDALVTMGWSSEGIACYATAAGSVASTASPLNRLSVSFNGAGGSSNPLQVVSVGGSVVLPTTERADYTFSGWYDGETKAGDAGDTYTPTESVILTAHWTANPAPVVKVEMHRLYNPYSGEHFYTSSVSERNQLRSAGWTYEGAGWIAPESSTTPVYRLYNRYAGDHHFTTSSNERDALKAAGWSYEGIGWYSDDDETTPLYRQYNPNATTGSHNYTTSKSENDQLVKLGWRAEGVGWYGV